VPVSRRRETRSGITLIPLAVFSHTISLATPTLNQAWPRTKQALSPRLRALRRWLVTLRILRVARACSLFELPPPLLVLRALFALLGHSLFRSNHEPPLEQSGMELGKPANHTARSAEPKPSSSEVRKNYRPGSEHDGAVGGVKNKLASNKLPSGWNGIICGALIIQVFATESN
jgi:hypothetical protein